MASVDTRLTQLTLDDFDDMESTDDSLLKLFIEQSDEKPKKVDVTIQAAKQNTILRKEIIDDLDKAIAKSDHAIEVRLARLEKALFKEKIGIWVNRKHFEDDLYDELNQSTNNEHSFINKCINELLSLQGEKKAFADELIKEIQQTQEHHGDDSTATRRAQHRHLIRAKHDGG